MSAFTSDAVRAFAEQFPGNQFVAERVEAASRFEAANRPTTAEEIWRYSRIEELDLDRYRPVRTATAITGVPEGRGLQVDDTFDVIDADIDVPDLFADLNVAFMSPTVLRVPAGTVISEPIVVAHTSPGPGTATFPRLVLDIGEDAEVTVVERFSSPDDEDSIVFPLLQIRTARAARVKYLAINELGRSSWQIGHQQAIGGRDSTMLLATVALGGQYARVRSEARVDGEGASTKQVALYFAADDQMHDFRTIQDHAAPHGNSDLLFKGAVQDDARSVYTGLIRIRNEAKGTNAFQTNRTLTLSEGSWAESVPNLEIETNDVHCSHASTVGPIDEDQRFYLESRGISSGVAERLIVLGFFDEVLDQLPAPELLAALRQQVADKLTVDEHDEAAA
ncbi:MAG: Fe-S cluster assembly protein SufD [Acidimicrobiia bacterium]|nr:Fe-S cluster assembly protein SufD [Acidimicrobiia bacterium]